MQDPGHLNLSDKKIVDIAFTKKCFQLAINEYLNIWDIKKHHSEKSKNSKKYRVIYTVNRNDSDLVLKENSNTITEMIIKLAEIYVLRGQAIWMKKLRGNFSQKQGKAELAMGNDPENVRILFYYKSKFIDLDTILQDALLNFKTRWQRYNTWLMQPNHLPALLISFPAWHNTSLFEQMSIMYHIFDRKKIAKH